MEIRDATEVVGSDAHVSVHWRDVSSTSGPAGVAGSSLDRCRRSLTGTEQTICAHPVLVRLDHLLTDAYKRFLFDPSIQERVSTADVRPPERSWPQERDARPRTSIASPVFTEPVAGGPRAGSSASVFPVNGALAGSEDRRAPGSSSL